MFFCFRLVMNRLKSRREHGWVLIARKKDEVDGKLRLQVHCFPLHACKIQAANAIRNAKSVHWGYLKKTKCRFCFFLLSNWKNSELCEPSPQLSIYLQVFVQNPPYGREGAVVSLVPDEPRLGRSQLLGVNEDETPRLGEGFEHKRCQPGGSADGAREVNRGRGREERY